MPPTRRKASIPFRFSFNTDRRREPSLNRRIARGKMAEYTKGWYQIAFASEIANELSSVRIGRKRLILVRSDDHFRIFSGDCPHRGANLATGGHLRGDMIICPF